MVAPIITPESAAALIKDGDTVFVGGNGGTGVAEAILVAI
jgi:propionate CoA-transferase